MVDRPNSHWQRGVGSVRLEAPKSLNCGRSVPSGRGGVVCAGRLQLPNDTGDMRPDPAVRIEEQGDRAGPRPALVVPHRPLSAKRRVRSAANPLTWDQGVRGRPNQPDRTPTAPTVRGASCLNEEDLDGPDAPRASRVRRGPQQVDRRPVSPVVAEGRGGTGPEACSTQGRPDALTRFDCFRPDLGRTTRATRQRSLSPVNDLS